MPSGDRWPGKNAPRLLLPGYASWFIQYCVNNKWGLLFCTTQMNFCLQSCSDTGMFQFISSPVSHHFWIPFFYCEFRSAWKQCLLVRLLSHCPNSVEVVRRCHGKSHQQPWLFSRRSRPFPGSRLRQQMKTWPWAWQMKLMPEEWKLASARIKVAKSSKMKPQKGNKFLGRSHWDKRL